MTGIDGDVIREQIKIVRDDQRLLQTQLQEEQQQEWAAMTAEQRAHDQVAEAQRLQVISRAAIDERTTTIGELQDLLELILPGQCTAGS